jgi:hypothetical protein
MPDRYPAAHNGLVAGSSPGEPFTISTADHLHSGEELRPKLQKFVATIALSRGEEIGKREPLLSFALVSNCTTHFRQPFCFDTANCIMWGRSRLPLRSLLAAVPSYAKEAREIVACAGIAQVEDKGDGTSHTVMARKR